MYDEDQEARRSDRRTSARRAVQPQARRGRQRSGTNTGAIVATVAAVLVVVSGGLMLIATQTPPTRSSVAPAAATPKPTSADIVTPAAPPPAPVAEQSESMIGSSVRGVPIPLVRFGSGPRRLLVVGGVHGNEYGAAVAEQLVSALRAQPDLVPAGSTIEVIACLNPDGRAAHTRANINGVDINRNLPASTWAAKLDKRDSSGGQGLTGGTTPASEPETKAFLAAYTTGYSAIISLHSRGGLVDFDGPGAEALAKEISVATGLPVKHLAYQPYIRGSMGQYLAEKGTPLVTVELNDQTLTDKLRSGILMVAGQN